MRTPVKLFFDVLREVFAAIGCAGCMLAFFFWLFGMHVKC